MGQSSGQPNLLSLMTDKRENGPKLVYQISYSVYCNSIQRFKCGKLKCSKNVILRAQCLYQTNLVDITIHIVRPCWLPLHLCIVMSVFDYVDGNFDQDTGLLV